MRRIRRIKDKKVLSNYSKNNKEKQEDVCVNLLFTISLFICYLNGAKRKGKFLIQFATPKITRFCY